MAITPKTLEEISNNNGSYAIYERKSIKGFFRYETSDKRTVTITEISKGVYLNFIVYYYWYSATACDLVIGWEPAYYDTTNNRYARYTSTLSTYFNAEDKIQLKLNGTSLSLITETNKLNGSRMLTTTNNVITPLSFTSSSFKPAWIGRITDVTSDIKNLEITFKYSNTVTPSGASYTITGLVDLTERNKIKIQKPSRYEHNVVFNEEGLNELIDNIRKYPVVNIEEVAATQWATVSDGQPSIKVTHGNPNFNGSNNYKYVKVGSNVKFLKLTSTDLDNLTNSSYITKVTKNNNTWPTQKTGTFRVSVNNDIFEVPINGLSGGSGSISLGGSLIPTIDSQTASNNGYNLGDSTHQWNILYARAAVFGNADEVEDGKSDAASNIRPYADETGSLGTSACRWNNIYGNYGRFRTLVVNKKDPIEAGKFRTILSIYNTDAYNDNGNLINGKVYEDQDIINAIGTGLPASSTNANSSYAFGSKAGTTCIIAGEGCQPTIENKALYNNENIYLLADSDVTIITNNARNSNAGWTTSNEDNANITSVTINASGNLIVNKGNVETSQGSIISHRFLSLYTYPDYGTSEKANIYYKKQASTTSTSEYGIGRFYTNKDFEANKVYGAVFNDYAEYRTTINLTPGHVVIDQDDGSLTCSFKRLQPGAQVISDTFGHSMGETDTAKTPLAVAGRVLVYTYQPRENYHAGMAVCSAPDGTIDIMTREEIRDYPDCIIGIVSEIPQYETWGSDNVKVDGRIWIKVR